MRLVCLILCVLLACSAYAKIDDLVSEVLEEQGEVDVIVLVEDVSLLAEEQTPIESLSAYATTVSEIEVAALAADENVVGIYYDEPVHIFLQDSVPLVNASAMWNLTYNGSSEAICIIDTGVNYLHPDLGGCFGTGCRVVGGYDFINSDTDPMDDHGHGTHVAGIAAARGNITGVAKGANIVAIKSLNQVGSGSASDVVNGINWCVNNASLYNISVISLSLGGSLNYSEYCDASYPSYATAITAAIAKNISVVVASGNFGNPTEITAPACIQGAIPVAAATKADEMASYSSRNWMVSIIAPGSTINSTEGASYSTRQGTSMAAPHVAGAIALLQDYRRGLGSIATPSSIVSYLNTSGVQIYDSISGLNYSRISLYSALLAADAVNPVVSLNTANQTQVYGSLILNCNCSDELTLKNVTLYGNWSGWGANTTNSSGANNQNYSFNVSPVAGSYVWNCYACDGAHCVFATSNLTFTILSDFDGDGVPDLNDTDDDNDAIADINDSLLGNSSNIIISNSSITNFSMLVNGSTNVSKAFSEVLNVTFLDGNISLVNFTHNFTNLSVLNLGEVSIISQSNVNSPSYFIVKGLDLSSTSYTKTITFSRHSSSANRICILDSEINNIGEMTSDCSGGSEVTITCDGTTQSGYGCTLAGSLYTVTGLSHSGLLEYTYTAPSLGGGGGGGVTKSIAVEFVDGTIGITSKPSKTYTFSAHGKQYSLKIMTLNSGAVNFLASEPKTFFQLSKGEYIELDFDSNGKSEFAVELKDIITRDISIEIRLLKEPEKPAIKDVKKEPSQPLPEETDRMVAIDVPPESKSELPVVLNEPVLEGAAEPSAAQLMFPYLIGISLGLASLGIAASLVARRNHKHKRFGHSSRTHGEIRTEMTKSHLNNPEPENAHITLLGQSTYRNKYIKPKH